MPARKCVCGAGEDQRPRAAVHRRPEGPNDRRTETHVNMVDPTTEKPLAEIEADVGQSPLEQPEQAARRLYSWIRSHRYARAVVRFLQKTRSNAERLDERSGSPEAQRSLARLYYFFLSCFFSESRGVHAAQASMYAGATTAPLWTEPAYLDGGIGGLDASYFERDAFQRIPTGGDTAALLVTMLAAMSAESWRLGEFRALAANRNFCAHYLANGTVMSRAALDLLFRDDEFLSRPSFSAVFVEEMLVCMVREDFAGHLFTFLDRNPNADLFLKGMLRGYLKSQDRTGALWRLSVCKKGAAYRALVHRFARVMEKTPAPWKKELLERVGAARLRAARGAAPGVPDMLSDIKEQWAALSRW